MTEKQWVNPLEWDSYHDESKFGIWETWCEWYEDWDQDVGALLKVISTAKEMCSHIDSDEVDDGHYWMSTSLSAWQEFTQALNNIPKRFKMTPEEEHGTEKA